MILQYHYTDHAKCTDVWVQTTDRAIFYYRTKRRAARPLCLDERRRMEVIAELALHEILVVGG